MPTKKETQQKIDKHPNVKGRILPYNIEAEQALLGSLMLDEQASIKLLDGLEREDFFSLANKSIFLAMYSLAVSDKPIDIVTLSQQLDLDGTKDKVGGVAYLVNLSNCVPSSDNYEHYRDIVKKNGMLRKLIDASSKISKHCYAGDETDNALQMAEQEIYGLSQKRDKIGFVSIGVASNQAINQIEVVAADPAALRGIITPFKGLNAMLGGLQRSDLILIAARPGQGKTSIGMNLISYAALANVRKTNSGKTDPYRCAVFSLEMPAMQLAKRMLCSVARVDMQNANSGKLSDKEWRDLFDTRARLDRAEIFIDDNSLTTPVEILSKCRRLKREKGLDLVMIDYLQLMSSGKRVESRQQEISEITRTLKIAAKELDIPILLLSQMSREVEKRQDKRPQMSDLRESGAIEQDADIIMFIYRKYETSDTTVDENTKSQVELHIAKHRNGATGVVDLRWDGKTVSFLDVDKNIERFAPKIKAGEQRIFEHKENNRQQMSDDGQFANVLQDIPTPETQELTAEEFEEIFD